jgi:hypothetical protein
MFFGRKHLFAVDILDELRKMAEVVARYLPDNFEIFPQRF